MDDWLVSMSGSHLKLALNKPLRPFLLPQGSLFLSKEEASRVRWGALDEDPDPHPAGPQPCGC